MTELFKTTRSKIVQIYVDAGQKFQATTKPYKSTQPLVFDVVEPQGGPPFTSAFAVATAGQVLNFFNYGVGDSISDGFGGTFNATDGDTNMEDSNVTNGGEDYVIEGISCTCRSTRINWGSPNPFTGSNVDVKAAFGGGNGTQKTPPVIADPAALMSPPQQNSPFNLQNLMAQTAFPLLSVRIQFDRKETTYIGTLDEVPEGGAKSFLMANGDPRVDNRYKIPEGYLWRHEGQPDSKLAMIVTLQNSIVIPITAVTLELAGQGLPTVPKQIAIDLTLRVHGMAISVPSSN